MILGMEIMVFDQPSVGRGRAAAVQPMRSRCEQCDAARAIEERMFCRTLKFPNLRAARSLTQVPGCAGLGL
jgi:hypothetical protein